MIQTAMRTAGIVKSKEDQLQFSWFRFDELDRLEDVPSVL
jgi:hypothetical protein